MSYGRADGFAAQVFSLANGTGFRADITDYGATLVRLLAPDRDGRLGDVVLGFDSVEDYATHPFFLGGTVGRYANRIAGGRFTLDGVAHQLSLNDGPEHARRHLHGGHRGFHKRPWHAERVEDSGGATLKLSRRSPEGEEGYPGNLDVTVAYSVPADRNELRIEFTAVADRATPLNLTNHAYFNLRGGPGNILGHRLQVAASRFTPIDSRFTPFNCHAPVEGTPFDFRTPHPIGGRVGDSSEQLLIAGGYDHNYVLDATGGTLSRAARVLEPESGRILEVWTTEPGLQFYSGNFLDGAWQGRGGEPLVRHAGFCLETQHFPDSPNQPSFPSTILRPGERFRSSTLYRFAATPDSGALS